MHPGGVASCHATMQTDGTQTFRNTQANFRCSGGILKGGIFFRNCWVYEPFGIGWRDGEWFPFVFSFFVFMLLNND